MKALMFLFAAALLTMAASTAQANISNTAIDSGGIAAVSIHQPSFGMTTVANEHVYLDSNHLWAANDLKGSMFFAAGKSEKVKLLCLDSINRFCVRSY